MSKPKIWGYCNAGCKWEAVHKEDFENAATYVKQYANNGKWFLETGKQYKIFGNGSIKFKYNVVLDGSAGREAEYTFTIPNNDKYANYVVFKVLEISTDAGLAITIVYEIAGIRYTEIISGAGLTLLEKDYLYVENADNVLLYNDDASYSLDLDNYYNKEEIHTIIDKKINSSITTALGVDY